MSLPILSRDLLSYLTIALFALFSSLLFAEEPGDLGVEVAYLHFETGYSVIQVIEFQRSETSNSGGVWLDCGGAAGLYWGNTRHGFYKLYAPVNSTEGFSFYRAKAKMLAPTRQDPRRSAELTLRYSVENPGSADEIRFGALEVFYEGRHARLETSEVERVAIERALRQKETTLIPLPNARALEHVLKFPDQNKYLVVDRARFPQEYSNSDVLIWKDGVLNIDSDVEREQRVFHGPYSPTSYILGNKDILYLPGSSDSGKKASLVPLNGSEVFLENVPIKKKTQRAEVYEQLSLPRERYRTPILRTPCEVLLGLREGVFSDN